MSSTDSQLNRPRLMRAPHTTPPLPATTSLLLSRGSTAWDTDDDGDDDGYDQVTADSTRDDDANALILNDGNKRTTATTTTAPPPPARRNHLVRLPQELILHILTYVHSDLLYPPQASHPLYFQPLEQRQQAAHLALLRLTAVSAQFASAILSPQAGLLWRRVDGSATFPVPRGVLPDAEEEKQQQQQQQYGRPARHLSPALLVALARTAGPAVTSLNLRGVHFPSANGEPGSIGIGSIFSAAQLFEHILKAQGVLTKQFAPPSFSFPTKSELGFSTSSRSKKVLEEGRMTTSPTSEETPLPPLPNTLPAPRVTQLTHLDLRSLRIDSVQLAPARRALAALLSSSPYITTLQLANADPRLVDDALLDTSLSHPHRLRELDLSRCAGVSALGLGRLLRKVESYQSQMVQAGDEDRAREAGMRVLRIVGLRATPPVPLDEGAGSSADVRRGAGRRGRGRAVRAVGDSETDEEEDPVARQHSTVSQPNGNGSSSARVHPLEDMLALLRQTSAHCLEVLEANYVLELTDVHILALTHVRPLSPAAPASMAGPQIQTALAHEQIKLSRALSSAKFFPLRRSALARALDESSNTSNVVHRTLFPHLRSLALSSNPRLTSASCGFLVGAVPHCETLEMAGWSSRAFLDHERDADGRRVRRASGGRGTAVVELPGDGPLVDLLESVPRVRRIDLEGAGEITDAVLRALTPVPPIRAGSPPKATSSEEEEEEEDVQPGQHLTHLILSHAYRLSARATLDLMRGATKLVHLELDDTRAGCDLVAKEWAMLMKARKSGLKAAASALALPFCASSSGTTAATGDGTAQVERAQVAPTPYLSLVDCRGFSKEEYERLSRRGFVRAREAIGVRPKLAHVAGLKLGSQDEEGEVAGGRGRDAVELLEAGGAGSYEWGRDWFGYEGRAEVMPVSTHQAGNPPQTQEQAGPSSEETIAPNVQVGSPSRASRLALALPLSLGIALVRRASGQLIGGDDERGEAFGGGGGGGEGGGGAAQLSLPGLPFRIRAHLGGGGGSSSSSNEPEKNNGGPDGDETNPALGVLKSFWGWQAVDTRAKARKKRLVKEEKVRKAAAAAAAAATASANASASRAGRPGGGHGASRSMSFGGLDAAARNTVGGESGGSNTGLRNSTAAALALLLRRTGASSAGAAMSAAFGPMSPPLSRSPSPPATAGIPIPGATATTPTSSPSGGSRLGLGRSRRSDSAGFGWSGSPSTPGGQSSMSAFSLMALAGQRGGATGAASRSGSGSGGGSSSFSFSFSPSTSPTWERGQQHHDRMRSSTDGSLVSHVSYRQALAFAEAAAEAGLSPTEAEMLAIAATSAPGSPLRARAQSGSGSSPGGAGPKRSRMSSRGSSSAFLLFSSPSSMTSELSPVRSRPSSVRSLKDRVREKGDRAKGRIRRLLSPGSSSGSGSGASGLPPRISSSQPTSGMTTPRRMMAPVASSSAIPLMVNTPASEPSVPQYYAPVERERGGRGIGMEGLGWDSDDGSNGMIRGHAHPNDLVSLGRAQTGKSIPCGKASSSKTRLDSFPRLSKYECDDGPRKIRKRRYQEASREFRKAFEDALSKLYAPAIADLTEYFVALNRSKRTWADDSSTSQWKPESEAIPASLPTALLLHSTAQSPAFYDELDRTFSKHSLRVVRFTGQECGTYRTTMQTLTKRIISQVATALTAGDEQSLSAAPEDLHDLKHFFHRHPSNGILVLHFPVVEEFPSRLLSDILVLLSQLQLPIAVLMGVTSQDAYEQAFRSMEAQGSLHISRFAITSGGPDEVFGRIVSQIFLDPVKPPPLHLDHDTYDFLHHQFFGTDNDIESLFDAIDLAILHHFHTVPTSAFCGPPIPAHLAEQTTTSPVPAQGWLPTFVQGLREEALSPFVDFSQDDEEQDDDDDAPVKRPHIRLEQLQHVPNPILVSGFTFPGPTFEETDGDNRKTHLLKMVHNDSYFLSQLPSLRHCVDLHMAWQARAIAVLCCIQSFLQNKDITEPAAWGRRSALREARDAMFAMAADSNNNLFGRALEGELGSTLKKMEVRMLELNAKQFGSLIELLTWVLFRQTGKFYKATEEPADDEGPELEERQQPELNEDLAFYADFVFARDQEGSDLSDLHETLQDWGQQLEDWRSDEDTARQGAVKRKREAERKAQLEVEEFVRAAEMEEEEGRLPKNVTEDGKVTTSIDGPLLFAEEPMTKEKLEKQCKARLDAMDVDERDRQIKSDQRFYGIRKDISKEIHSFLSSKCQPLRTSASVPGATSANKDAAAAPLAWIWQCRSSKYLLDHLEAAPRHDVITHLDNPFTTLEGYGMAQLITGSQRGGSGHSHSQIDDADELGPAQPGTIKFIKSLKDLRRSGALPDVCRAYQLYRDSPRFLNFADWFDAFAQGVRADCALLAVSDKDQNDVGGLDDEEVEDDDLPDAAELRNGRPKRKRKDDDMTPTGNRRKSARAGQAVALPSSATSTRTEHQAETVANSKEQEDIQDIQARFALAVNELAIMGFLKGTRRKVEHTTKVIFDLPGV
ncbi:unnamed protein product [Tilletia controversa]|nr:unnamed protein product [Tilletia controversa]CAD6972090.1 unnamed protein product [Tilletia controversa]